MDGFRVRTDDPIADVVSRTIDDAIVGEVVANLFTSKFDRFFPRAIDFVLPAEDFCGREEGAEVIYDFGCWDEFSEQSSVPGCELTGVDGFQRAIGTAAKDLTEAEVGNGAGMEDSIVHGAR